MDQAQLARLSDDAAREVAALLQVVDGTDDVERLRAGFRVLAGAVPDLVLTAHPVLAVVATSRAALEGTWP